MEEHTTATTITQGGVSEATHQRLKALFLHTHTTRGRQQQRTTPQRAFVALAKDQKPKEVTLRKATFSVFDESDAAEATEVVRSFLELERERAGAGASAEEILQAVVDKGLELVAEEGKHPLLVKYAVTVFVNHAHNVDLKRLKKDLPKVREHSWHHIHPLIATEAEIAKPKAGDTDPNPQLHSNWASETHLAYWREDQDLNSHHWNWHTVFPSSGVPLSDGSKKTRRKPRQGELFLYRHRQLLARYDAERLSVQLRPVRPYGGHSYREPIPYGYDGHLVSFAPRPAGVGMADNYTRQEFTTQVWTVNHLETWRDRIFDAIEKGTFKRRQHHQANFSLFLFSSFSYI